MDGRAGQKAARPGAPLTTGHRLRRRYRRSDAPAVIPRTVMGGQMKGDRVEIVVETGGEPRTYEVAATRAGRHVEITISRGVVTVAEVTRGGSVTRTARFMANRVLALVDHPAPRPALPDDLPLGNGARPDV